MTQNKPEDTEDSITLVKIIGYGLLILSTLFIFFVIYKFTKDFPIFTWDINNRSREEVLDHWKDTSSILNSLLSPILLLFSVVLLWLTWRTSKKELEETKSLLKSQNINQKFKDDIDLYSRRVNTLSKKFEEQFKKKSMPATEESAIALVTVAQIYDDEVIANRIYENFDKSLVDKYSTAKFKNHSTITRVHDYLYQYLIKGTINLNTIIKYSALRGKFKNNMDFIKFSKRDLMLYETVIDRLWCYYFEKDLSNYYLIDSFNLLLMKICEVPKEQKNDFIDELLLNFDREVVEILIQKNEKIPNDILKP